MANIIDLMVGIQYDTNWGIWADGTEPTSNARYGQRQFENGGMLDGWQYIGNGVQIGNFIDSYCDGCEDDDLEYFAREAAEQFLQELD